MDNNIVIADLSRKRAVVSRTLYQYDYGIQIVFEGVELPDTFQAHFSNREDVGASVTQIGSNNAVLIPDELLQTGKSVFCWVYLHEGETDGETVYKVIIPVSKRSEPTDIEPTPAQQDTIDQLISALNTGVSRSETSAASAETNAEHVDEAAQQVAQDLAQTQQYRNEAETFASSAEASATSAGQSAASASTSENNAKDSADSAEASADRAEQAATNAGYMAVSIVDGHLIYERTDQVSADFSLIDGHLVMEGV